MSIHFTESSSLSATSQFFTNNNLTAFETYLALEKNLQPNTICSYMSDLLQFTKSQLTPEEFIQFLLQKQLAISSIKRKYSALKQYYKFHKQTLSINLPSHNHILKLVCPHKIKELIETCTNIKYQAFLYTLLATGCRVSETLTIRTSTITHCIKQKQLHLIIKGKGNKERVVFLSSKALKLLQNYIARYKPFTYLFSNRYNKPLTRQWAHKIIKQLSNNLGYDNIHPHSFRHAHAMILLESGADLLSIQKLLGHSTLKTTQIYLEQNWQHLEQALTKHPLSSIAW